MASSSITSWQIEGKKVETVTDCLFLGSKITVGSDYIHEIKTLLLFERKAMTNLDSVLRSRDITLLTKVPTVKAMIFRRLSAKELMLLNCGAGEDSSESLGQQGDQISQS